ncbi:MAG: ADP-ribosylglycohydrolase family protein [Acidobacteria bacterium]|nr:ADP-ribosylglycohydrolase family protein [Acidobacteriota bacterium]
MRQRTATAADEGAMGDVDDGLASRAQGCLLGQLAGDSLGSLVEFETPQAILRRYPDGVRELADGGTWDTLAGQPTDDSELALMLAHSLVEHGRYDQEAVGRAYVHWLESGPFDSGGTIRLGLTSSPNPSSQANGALMRISPLGIFGVRHEPEQVMEWARQDAAITHPHEVCRQANALFTASLRFAIASGAETADVYAELCRLP